MPRIQRGRRLTAPHRETRATLVGADSPIDGDRQRQHPAHRIVIVDDSERRLMPPPAISPPTASAARLRPAPASSPSPSVSIRPNVNVKPAGRIRADRPERRLDGSLVRRRHGLGIRQSDWLGRRRPCMPWSARPARGSPLWQAPFFMDRMLAWRAAV